jgi:antitoxin HicB
MSKRKDLNYYLAQPYTIQITREDETTWFARVLELPGCMTEGNTPEEAADMIQDALASWLTVALEDGRPIPEPQAAEAYSGRFVVRVPRTLHQQLVEAAKQEGVSLNQLINVALAGRVVRPVTPKAKPAGAVTRTRAPKTARVSAR